MADQPGREIIPRGHRITYVETFLVAADVRKSDGIRPTSASVDIVPEGELDTGEGERADARLVGAGVPEGGHQVIPLDSGSRHLRVVHVVLGAALEVDLRVGDKSGILLISRGTLFRDRPIRRRMRCSGNHMRIIGLAFDRLDPSRHDPPRVVGTKPYEFRRRSLSLYRRDVDEVSVHKGGHVAGQAPELLAQIHGCLSLEAPYKQKMHCKREDDLTSIGYIQFWEVSDGDCGKGISVGRFCSRSGGYDQGLLDLDPDGRGLGTVGGDGGIAVFYQGQILWIVEGTGAETG